MILFDISTQVILFSREVKKLMAEGYEEEDNTMQALDHLLQLLRMPSSPEQEAQVMSFLTRNPSLMAAFINPNT